MFDGKIKLRLGEQLKWQDIKKLNTCKDRESKE